MARRDDPEVQVIVDGTAATRAQVAANAASQFLLLRGIGGEPGMRPAVALASLAPRVMYNQRLKTPVYMLPRVLATLLLNVTALVNAMGMARERETGTLEQILVTPIRPAVFLAGKCLPYVLFGLVDILAILLLGNLICDVPFRGSFTVIALASFLYLFSTLGIWILIAAVSSSGPRATDDRNDYSGDWDPCDLRCALPEAAHVGGSSGMQALGLLALPRKRRVPARHDVWTLARVGVRGSSSGATIPNRP